MALILQNIFKGCFTPTMCSESHFTPVTISVGRFIPEGCFVLRCSEGRLAPATIYEGPLLLQCYPRVVFRKVIYSREYFQGSYSFAMFPEGYLAPAMFPESCFTPATIYLGRFLPHKFPRVVDGESNSYGSQKLNVSRLKTEFTHLEFPVGGHPGCLILSLEVRT